jgi:DNA mismatch repair protein MutH
MFNSKEEIFKIAESCEGKTFLDIDKKHVLNERGNKGALGHVIEMNVFGYDRNSNSEPDFKKFGLELKVSPYKKNKNGTYSAKERLVLNIIDYKREYRYDFYDSSFWHKNSNILLMLYEHLYNRTRDNFKITHTYDLKLDENENDLKIFKQDFNIIKNKILSGNAHNISEADTMYLGACTKGATAASSYRSQPFNTRQKAKQRAYSLKTTYMTQLIRKIIKAKKYETIFLDQELNERLSFEENIKLKISKYYGMSIEELMILFSIKTKSKNITEVLFSRMLGLKGKVSHTDEFIKANIIPKYIRVNANGKIRESMSFPSFKFKEIVEQEWYDSDLYNYFNEHKFLFVIYEFNSDGELIFSDVILWNMPLEILETEVKKVFDETVRVIKSGNIVKSIDSSGRRNTNFPDKKFNNIAHVRPHGRNKKDVYPIPIPDKLTGLKEYTKHCFWLNNSYIKNIIEG